MPLDFGFDTLNPADTGDEKHVVLPFDRLMVLDASAGCPAHALRAGVYQNQSDVSKPRTELVDPLPLISIRIGGFANDPTTCVLTKLPTKA
jgi:hypothetical protein